MGITALFDSPFFSGGNVSSLVPSLFPVALNGRPYMIDTQPETFYVRWLTETIPLIRQQADQSSAPAEQTLNPAGFWRRSQDSWHHGAGQVFRDRDSNADAYRFRSSQGINVWTPYQISLLPDTTFVAGPISTNLFLAVAGARLYYCDDRYIFYTSDITGSVSWTTTTYAGGTVLSLVSDGYTLYATDGSNVYTSNTGSSTFTAVNTLDCTLLGYVKSRLMAANGPTIYNITVIGTPPAALFTHANSNFTWVAFAEGLNWIYAAGYSGDKSTIYKTAIKPDGTALDVPTVAGALPTGEIVTGLKGYLGFVFIGTNKGWRFAEEDSNGNLTIGALVATLDPVQCFEGDGKYVRFGWSNFGTTYTGLGSIDFSVFTEPLVPAYASDLMVLVASGSGDAHTENVAGTAAVRSIAIFQNRRVFTVVGTGVMIESTDLVRTGTMDMGLVGFGLPDPKIAVEVHTDTQPLAGSYTVSMAHDSGTFTTLGSVTAANDVTEGFIAGQVSAERFEIRLVLTRDAVTTTGPTILRWTLKAVPTLADGPAEIFHVPLQLYPVINVKDQDYAFDVEFEKAIISALRSTRQIVTYQEFNTSYTGFVTDFKWYPFGLIQLASGEWGERGTLLVDLQRIS